MGLRVWGLEGLGLRVMGVEGLGFRVMGIEGLMGFRAWRRGCWGGGLWFGYTVGFGFKAEGIGYGS